MYEEFPTYDYFIKVDSDTYFSGYNFKHVVMKMRLDASAPHYFGHVDYHKAPSLFALGLGIAISRGTLLRLGPHLPTIPSKLAKCDARNNWAEDWEFFKCLKRFNLQNVRARMPCRRSLTPPHRLRSRTIVTAASISWREPCRRRSSITTTTRGRGRMCRARWALAQTTARSGQSSFTCSSSSGAWDTTGGLCFAHVAWRIALTPLFRVGGGQSDISFIG